MKRNLVLISLLINLSVFGQTSATFRGNLQHTGVYDSAPIPSFTRIKWQFQTHGPVISSPVVADGMVFFGSADHNLYAVDRETGAQKWKFSSGSRIASSPAVANQMVYFLSYDSNFYAVDETTGQLKWKFKTGGERRFAARHIHGAEPAAETMPDPFDFFLSSAAVWNGSIYFGSSDGNIYALDAATGNLKWKFKTGDVVHASPAIAGGTVFVGSWDSYFYAIDAATGKEKWRFKTGEDHDTYNQVGIQSSAAIGDGMVYFGCRDSNFYALEQQTGAEKWKFNNKGSWVIASPAVREGKVYFATSDSGKFYAADAKTGAILFTLDMHHWPAFSSPAIAGRMLYMGTHEGKLESIDTDAQKVAWAFQTEASKKNSSTYVKTDGTPNYEAAFEGDFYDDIVIGVGRMFSLGPILSSPAVVDGVVYVGSMDGNLYALQ